MKKKRSIQLLVTGIIVLVVSGIVAFTWLGNTSNGDQTQVTDSLSADNSPTFGDIHGNTVSLGSLKGKVVFLNFWATWCPPCIAEMPSINTLRQKLSDRKDIVFLMVDMDGDAGKSQAFMDRNTYTLPVYVPNGPIPPEMLGNAIPTTVVLDKTGKIVFRHEGGADYSHTEFMAFISNL